MSVTITVFMVNDQQSKTVIVTLMVNDQQSKTVIVTLMVNDQQSKTVIHVEQELLTLWVQYLVLMVLMLLDFWFSV
jgi:hypothetical protein